MKGLTGFYKVFGLEPLPEDLNQFSKASSNTDTFTGAYSYIRDGVDLNHYSDALELAKHYLIDWHGDYLFFQDSRNSSSADYVLVKGDLDRSGRNLTFSGEGLLFRYSTGVTRFNNSYTENGTIDFPSLTINNGSGSSSATPAHTENFSYDAFWNYHAYQSMLTVNYYTFDNYSVTLDNSDFYYSSFADTPHLVSRSGVNVLAAFLVTFAVFVVVMWFAHIFRIVTRR